MKTCFLVLALVLYAVPVHAAIVGRTEGLHELQDIPNTSNVIAYKTTGFNLVLGVYVLPDGYVMLDRNRPEIRGDLDEATIAKLQAEGRLPDPMPAYSMSLTTILFGYSLWIVVALLIVLVIFWRMLRKGGKQPQRSARTSSRRRRVADAAEAAEAEE